MIMSHLCSNKGGKTRFSSIKKDLGLKSYGLLAWHLKVLEKSGYIKSNTIGKGPTAQCYIKATPKGVKSLTEVVGFIDGVLRPVTTSTPKMPLHIT